MKIYLDVTRLATRILRSSPSGIDRVEYNYAKHLLQSDDTVCVFTVPVFSGAMRRSRALDILNRVERAWRAAANPQDDANYVALRGWLDSPLDFDAPRPVRFNTERRWGHMLREADFFPLRDFIRAGARLDRWVERNSGEPGVFFHASHAQLHKPHLFQWLKNAGLRSAFFLHDAIPIDYPEFCSPGSFDRHVVRLNTVSANANLVIVNSSYSRRTIAAALASRGSHTPDIEVLPLAIDEAFVKAKRTPGKRPDVPYFLFVGNIEPRKNILFLLEVWRRIVNKHGARAPRLVIAGRRGWENENIVDVLERSRGLAPFVAEASDLTDASLARLMADASALVAPSFTEGFSLPVVECLSAGTPAIASDIEAHHEIAEDYALFADAIDGPAWVAAIEELMDPTSDLRQERLAKLENYRPLSWAEHVAAARDMLERCARGA